MTKFLRLLAAGLAAAGLAVGAGSALAQKAETPKKEAPAKKAEAPKAALMDINTASEAELATLKGIGEVRARAIVKGRPYKGKDELVQKKIIPKGVYEEIREQIIARQG